MFRFCFFKFASSFIWLWAPFELVVMNERIVLLIIKMTWDVVQKMELCLLKIFVIWLHNLWISQTETHDLSGSLKYGWRSTVFNFSGVDRKMCSDKTAVIFQSFLDKFERFIYIFKKKLTMNATWCKFDVENKGKTFHHNVLVV